MSGAAGTIVIAGGKSSPSEIDALDSAFNANEDMASCWCRYGNKCLAIQLSAQMMTKVSEPYWHDNSDVKEAHEIYTQEKEIFMNEKKLI